MGVTSSCNERASEGLTSPMDLFLSTTCVFLAAVFGIAGLAKLVDRTGSQQAIIDFGLPSIIAQPLAVMLPFAELMVAIALLSPLSTRLAAVGALVLLFVFITGIGYNLVHGRQPSCHCFGQLHKAPAGKLALFRNTLLAVLAGFIAWMEPYNAESSIFALIAMWVNVPYLGAVIAAIALVVLCITSWAILQLISQNGRILVRIEALESAVAANHAVNLSHSLSTVYEAHSSVIGMPAPHFRLTSVIDDMFVLGDVLLLGKPVALIFVDPQCGPCTTLLPEIARWQREYGQMLTVAVISRGDLDLNRSRAIQYGLAHFLLQENSEIAEAYKVTGTPAAVLIHSDGTIGSGIEAGIAAVRSLIMNWSHTLGATSLVNRDEAVQTDVVVERNTALSDMAS